MYLLNIFIIITIANNFYWTYTFFFSKIVNVNNFNFKNESNRLAKNKIMNSLLEIALVIFCLL